MIALLEMIPISNNKKLVAILVANKVIMLFANKSKASLYKDLFYSGNKLP